MYDVIIIGGGIVGTAVLDRLARYDKSVLLLESADDVVFGATRANSGIVHAGYDCDPGTLKARFNVRGNELTWKLVEELDVPAKKCGSLVVAPEEGLDGLKKLYDKGVKNGVKVELWNREQTVAFEPNVSDNIAYSLYAPEAGIVSPYQFAIALADRGILNGGEIKTEAEVKSLTRENDVWKVETAKGTFYAKTVINCAGANGASVCDMAGAEHYDTEYRRGDYFVLDNAENKNVNTVIFPLPTAAGKGILVAPTADGNVIYGPTSIPTVNGDTAVTLDGLDEIRKNVSLTYKSPAYRKCIRIYAGVRTVVGHDFVVGKSALVPDFIMAVGICSPGLSSAPAIAEYIEGLYLESEKAELKDNLVVEMPKHKRLMELGEDELNALIEKDPAWGRIVCRCEKVTEAEIVRAIHSPLPATTVDAVKRRVRAGMGRCQGGFCAPRVMEILSRELGKPITEIRKGFGDSNIARYPVKEVPND